MPEDKRKCTDQFEPSTPPETHPGILTFGFEVFKLTPQAKMPLKCLVIGPLSTLTLVKQLSQFEYENKIMLIINTVYKKSITLSPRGDSCG